MVNEPCACPQASATDALPPPQHRYPVVRAFPFPLHHIGNPGKGQSVAEPGPAPGGLQRGHAIKSGFGTGRGSGGRTMAQQGLVLTLMQHIGARSGPHLHQGQWRGLWLRRIEEAAAQSGLAHRGHHWRCLRSSWRGRHRCMRPPLLRGRRSALSRSHCRGLHRCD